MSLGRLKLSENRIAIFLFLECMPGDVGKRRGVYKSRYIIFDPIKTQLWSFQDY